MIQEIVKEYAKKKVLNVFNSKKKFKIVLINNVDNLSYYAQTSLRCTMEKYVKTCKFILCGYQVTKIIDPLKSRCLCIRVPTPSNDHIFLTLFKISVKEKRNLSLDKYNYILDKCNNNIKNALWMLELSFYNIPIEWSWKNSISQIVKIILNSSKVKINTSHIESIRSILYTIFITNISGINILKELLYQLLENIDNENIRSETINIVSKHEHDGRNHSADFPHRLKGFGISVKASDPCRHKCTSGIVHPDQRDSVVPGHQNLPCEFCPVGGIHGPGADGEIMPIKRDISSLDVQDSCDDSCAVELGSPILKGDVRVIFSQNSYTLPNRHSPLTVLHLNSAFTSPFFWKFNQFASSFHHFQITGRDCLFLVF